MQAKDIARMLAADAESVCRYLLPQGKRDGHEWRAGSTGGEPGQSLGVHLTGDKAGIWADFAGDGKGDLLDLWRATRSVTLPDAMREACAYLGVAEPTFASGKAPPCKPTPAPKVDEVPRGSVSAWLEDRGLSTAALEAYRVGSQGDEIVMPFYRDGDLVAVKYRNVHDKRKQRVEKGGAMPLFGWQAIPDNARSVVITEGELDAVACWQMGFPALSVPNGAQGLTWIEVEFGALERFDVIHVWMDADEQGQTAARKIVDRLGAHRCRVVRQAEGKDANDALVKRLDASKLIAQAQTLDPVELKSAGAFTDEVIRLFYPPPDSVPGIRLPWEKTEGKVLLRPAELTIVSGINGHGKSLFTSQIALDACAQGHRACIASMEMQPQRTLHRMVRQAAAMSSVMEREPTPAIPYIRQIQAWLDDKLWLFAVTGTAKADRMMEVFKYAHKRYGIGLFVVDSLSKCGIDEDDYNGQKQLVERLKDFTLDTNAHVLLIAHPRKGAGEDEQPGKMDVRGAQSITDMADNGCSLWRNKRKEEAQAKPENDRTEADKKQLEWGDAYLHWWKSRNGNWEGKVSLWWHEQSQQFLGSDRSRPRRYVEFSHASAA
jgi:twinkle protein